MRRGFSLLVATIIGAALAHSSAQAAPLPPKPTAQNAVAKATFFVDRKKETHVHTGRKHRHHAHKHAHLKKAPRKHHDKH